MPMPMDIKQLRSLLGGLSYYRKFLPDMARLIHPITALLKKGAAFVFTSTMEDIVRALLASISVYREVVVADAGVHPVVSFPPKCSLHSWLKEFRKMSSVK